MEIKITAYPMECPVCKLYKEFVSEEARDKFLDDHVRKCIELDRKLRAKESGAALEAIEHAKASSKVAPGEVPKEIKGKELILDEVVYQDGGARNKLMSKARKDDFNSRARKMNKK